MVLPNPSGLNETISRRSLVIAVSGTKARALAPQAVIETTHQLRFRFPVGLLILRPASKCGLGRVLLLLQVAEITASNTDAWMSTQFASPSLCMIEIARLLRPPTSSYASWNLRSAGVSRADRQVSPIIPSSRWSYLSSRTRHAFVQRHLSRCLEALISKHLHSFTRELTDVTDNFATGRFRHLYIQGPGP